MNSKISVISHSLLVGILSVVIFAPSLFAIETTPWDAMLGASYNGTATVTTQQGEKLKAPEGVVFSQSTVRSARFSVQRQDVKEVVIRARRDLCCGSLGLAIVPFFYLVETIQGHVSPDIDRKAVLIGAPLIIGVAAVTAPPLLAIEGLRRLKPAKVLYRVIP
jgi:hypothetical protein